MNGGPAFPDHERREALRRAGFEERYAPDGPGAAWVRPRDGAARRAGWERTRERAEWPFWCAMCEWTWFRLGYEPPLASRCPRCLEPVYYLEREAHEQPALFGPSAEEIPDYDPEALVW